MANMTLKLIVMMRRQRKPSQRRSERKQIWVLVLRMMRMSHSWEGRVKLKRSSKQRKRKRHCSHKHLLTFPSWRRTWPERQMKNLARVGGDEEEEGRGIARERAPRVLVIIAKEAHHTERE